MYSKRINRLCSLLFAVESFADIGCDHGYCSEYMLKNDLCKRAVVTDISEACLQKAENLLAQYVEKGVCSCVCTNGLQGVDENTDLVLIAGMGGMEIVHILTAEAGFIPKNFVFQPMRDANVLRALLLSRGAHIQRDFTFFDGKYYNVITGTASGEKQAYTEAELLLGKENIQKRGQDFLNFLQAEIEKCQNLFSRPLKENALMQVRQKLNYLQGVLRGEIK